MKTRILAGEHQLLRVDEEGSPPLTEAEADDLLDRVVPDLHQFDSVILSDYSKGVCTPYLCQRLIHESAARGVPLYVDPKGVNYRKYKGATAVKPNQPEITLLAQAEGWQTGTLEEWGDKLKELLDLKFVALTMGSRGITLLAEGGIKAFPTVAKEVFDVSGAGDAVIAAMASGLACGLSLADSVMLGNVAAGIVVSKVGCVPVERTELIVATQSFDRGLASAKQYSTQDAEMLTTAWTNAGNSWNVISADFDLFHPEAIKRFDELAAQADYLVVLIASDGDEYLGKITHHEKIRLLAALEAVDVIVAEPRQNLEQSSLYPHSVHANLERRTSEEPNSIATF